MRQLSNKPLSKDDAVDALNREIVPYIRDLGKKVDYTRGAIIQLFAPGSDGTLSSVIMSTSPSPLWNGGDSAYGVIMPYGGNVRRITSKNPTPDTGGSETVTYTLITSSDGGVTWSDSPVYTESTADDTAVKYTDGSVRVEAGSKVAIRVSFSGYVVASGPAAMSEASIWFERDA